MPKKCCRKVVVEPLNKVLCTSAAVGRQTNKTNISASSFPADILQALFGFPSYISDRTDCANVLHKYQLQDALYHSNPVLYLRLPVTGGPRSNLHIISDLILY